MIGCVPQRDITVTSPHYSLQGPVGMKPVTNSIALLFCTPFLHSFSEFISSLQLQRQCSQTQTDMNSFKTFQEEQEMCMYSVATLISLRKKDKDWRGMKERAAVA